MSVHFIPLHQYKENFKVTSATPVYIAGGAITANDIASFAAWFEIDNCSAGITALNPGTITVEYTPDDGTTWITVPGMIGGSVTGDSVDVNLQASSATGVFPPVIRFKFVAPMGEEYYVKKIRRVQFAPGYVASLRSAFSSVVGFGVVTNAARVANIQGAPDVVPTPSATGYNYITSTAFTKSVANDARALDVNVAGASFTQKIVNYNGSDIIPVFNNATPANNKGMPVILTAGDALAPVEMGTGADSARTLRTTLSTRHETVTTPLANRLTDGTNALGANENVTVAQQTVGAAYRLPVNAIQYGWNGAAHTEILIDTAGATLLSTRHETVTTPLANKLSDGTNFLGSFSNVAVAQYSPGAGYKLPVSAIISGWNGAAHTEILLDTNGATLLSTRHETAGTPLAQRPSDGTNFLTWSTLANATRYTNAAQVYTMPVLAAITGYDTTNNTRKELATNTNGQLQTEITNPTSVGKVAYGTAQVPIFWSFSGATIYTVTGSALVATVWKEIIASTSADIYGITYWNPTAEIIELGIGAGGGEVSKRIMKPGDGELKIYIPAGTRISLRCTNAIASDTLVLDFIG